MTTKTEVRTITYVDTRGGGPFFATTMYVPKTEEDRRAILALARKDGVNLPSSHPMKGNPVFFKVMQDALLRHHGVKLVLERN